jgi:hypothetical protein
MRALVRALPGQAAPQNSIAKARQWPENRLVPPTHPISHQNRRSAMFESFKHLFVHDSGTDAARAAPFDDDDIVLLDAEDLADGGILEAYEQLHPQLRQHEAADIDIAEEFDAEAGTYAVLAAGTRYDIRGADAQGDAWVLATIAFFEIVNASLAQATHRFYALYGGKDLAGIFLTGEQFQNARQDIERHADWPWTPVNRAPDYGFPYDEEASA